MDATWREDQERQGRALADVLSRDGVDGVALTYVDNAGVTRVKAVPIAGLAHAAGWGAGMSPVFDVFCVDDSITAGRLAGGPTGDLRLHPDLDRVVGLAGQPGWAWAPGRTSTNMWWAAAGPPWTCGTRCSRRPWRSSARCSRVGM